MKYNKTIKSYHKISFLLTLGLGLGAINCTQAKNIDASAIVAIPDSIGSEVINGQRYVIHKLEPKETYYQLSRIYSVSVKDIMDANNKQNLRVGNTVKIPRGAAVVQSTTPPTNNKASNNKVLVNPEEVTEYKVGKSETLYAISKRFSISIEDIKKVNNMSSNTVKEGQILKIPNNPLVPEPQIVEVIETPEIIQENQQIDDSMFKPNRYGISEKKERGIGVWMEGLSDDNNTSLALHKTAPIGTILKITNPMNRSVTFAKVVGKFADNEATQNAIVVLSKSVATSVGALDRKFQIEIAYGVPLD